MRIRQDRSSSQLSTLNYQLSIINRSRAGTLALQRSTINYQSIASGDARTATINSQLSSSFPK
ncbi:MAG: hypothetical protein ACRC62_13175 [Microcoleus sp.]